MIFNVSVVKTIAMNCIKNLIIKKQLTMKYLPFFLFLFVMVSCNNEEDIQLSNNIVEGDMLCSLCMSYCDRACHKGYWKTGWPCYLYYLLTKVNLSSAVDLVTFLPNELKQMWNNDLPLSRHVAEVWQTEP